jgi:hypothetical protein
MFLQSRIVKYKLRTNTANFIAIGEITKLKKCMYRINSLEKKESNKIFINRFEKKIQKRSLSKNRTFTDFF